MIEGKVGSRINDENRPPSDGSEGERIRELEALKPRPTQRMNSARSPVPTKAATSPIGAKTPSPPRGRRLESLHSPSASESSPGRGYAEAYQRIVEEDALAQEESMEDLEEFEPYDVDDEDDLQGVDHTSEHRRQNEESPISLRASRRASPRGAPNEPTPAQGQIRDTEDRVHDSGNESSPSLDLTQDFTDTSIGSGSSQHSKYLIRLGALKSGTKAFNKASGPDKAGSILDKLQRRRKSDDSIHSSISLGSRASEPSLNIPRQWGRKAKPGKDWLNRINSKSGRFTGDSPKRHSSSSQIIAESQRREWEDPIDEWVAKAADVPLPVGDEGSSQARLSSQGSTPRTAVLHNESPDRRQQWEIDGEEFTGRSLQVSDSPPLRIRNGALDRVREREIVILEKRAVTTGRLGELRQKLSEEGLSRSNGEPGQSLGNGSLSSSPEHSYWSRKETTRRDAKRQDDEKGSDSAAGTSQIAVTETANVRAQSESHDASEVDGESSKERAIRDPRPSKERQDSHDLLRRLARSISESPSSTPDRGAPQGNTEKERGQMPFVPRNTSTLKTPVITGAWIDQTFEDLPEDTYSKANFKTPLVTGAWIDTPLPTGGRGPPMPTPSDQEESKELSNGRLGAADLIHRLSHPSITPRPALPSQPLKYSGPPLPKSALDEILKDAKSDKSRKIPESEEDPTLHLGESTIQSLEDLLAKDDDFSTLLAATPPQGSPPPQTSIDLFPSSLSLTSTSRTSRLSDLQSYTHLLSRLTTLAPSLRASKKQLASLERAVSAPSTDRTQQPLTEPDTTSLQPCQRCGCLHPITTTTTSSSSSSTPSQTYISLILPIPRLWHWPLSSPRPRLTRLGLLVLAAWALLYAEFWARDRFCHPLYASSMVGYGVDINAPRPPFVFAKVVWRGVGFEGLVGWVRVVTRVLAGVVGWVVGFLGGGEGDGGREAVQGGGMAMGKGKVGSMMDDEFL